MTSTENLQSIYNNLESFLFKATAHLKLKLQLHGILGFPLRFLSNACSLFND